MATTKPPYFAVVFTSRLKPGEQGYEAMAERMLELVSRQPGFLGFDSARSPEGAGITVSYWDSLESIHAWKAVPEHESAQKKGRSHWYSNYRIRIASVLEDYSFPEPEQQG
jgi:heme-degrading monooxygenase HmoA